MRVGPNKRSNLLKEPKGNNFCDQFWVEFWNKFCAFCKKFACLTLFVVVFFIFLNNA